MEVSFREVKQLVGTSLELDWKYIERMKPLWNFYKVYLEKTCDFF